MLTRIWNWIKSFFVKPQEAFIGYGPTGRGSGNSHQRRVARRAATHFIGVDLASGPDYTAYFTPTRGFRKASGGPWIWK